MPTIPASADRETPLFQRMICLALAVLDTPTRGKPSHLVVMNHARILADNLRACGVETTRTRRGVRQTLAILTQPNEWFALDHEDRLALLDALADFIEVTR